MCIVMCLWGALMYALLCGGYAPLMLSRPRLDEMPKSIKS
jgi:hypothetical protein